MSSLHCRGSDSVSDFMADEAGTVNAGGTAEMADTAIPADMAIREVKHAADLPEQGNSERRELQKKSEPGQTSPLAAGDQQFLRVLLTVFTLIFAVEWLYVTSRQPEQLHLNRGEYFQNYFRIEINSATWIDWIQLEGIGPALAHRIDADRRVNGPFDSIDDLLRVSGIGQVTLERIRFRLYMDPVLISASESAEQFDQANTGP